MGTISIICIIKARLAASALGARRSAAGSRAKLRIFLIFPTDFFKSHLDPRNEFANYVDIPCIRITGRGSGAGQGVQGEGLKKRTK